MLVDVHASRHSKRRDLMTACGLSKLESCDTYNPALYDPSALAGFVSYRRSRVSIRLDSQSSSGAGGRECRGHFARHVSFSLASVPKVLDQLRFIICVVMWPKPPYVKSTSTSTRLFYYRCTDVTDAPSVFFFPPSRLYRPSIYDVLGQIRCRLIQLRLVLRTSQTD
ncbi:unnamed protein product [Soboliphyme baturini]|uniref:Uncharacterized protein n=1 Tax=Soboliphyme baturini TaxID=241478 RepID=A0A183IR76_9BILA|nr:unnamed protein product [Soboliphyme baturini]